jgi:putative ABC transport system permease protein
MSRLKGFAARLRSVLHPREAEARMEEEFRFHVEMETQRLIEQGASAEDARRHALVAFGGLDHHRENMRDERGARWFEDVLADIRYALRAIRRSPGVALAVAITLGVGIGVNGVIFGYINSMFFRPVPAPDPEQLVAVFTRDTRTGSIDPMSYEDYLDYRDRSGVFAGLAGVVATPLNLALPGAVDREVAGDMIWGEMVTENFFSLLDMHPAVGRFFTASDAPQGANPFAVLSYESWRTRFHSDPNVVGRVVRLNGASFTITGVAPQGFRGMRMFGFWPEMWVPIGMHDVAQPGSSALLRGRGSGMMLVVGRTKPNARLADVQHAAALFATQLERAFAATNTNVSVLLVPAKSGFENPAFVKPAVLLLSSTLGLFASLMTLLVICANLANLQLSRVAARAKEIAIRLSLGCSRARLTRQLLVESSVLALPGVVLAAVLLRLGMFSESYLAPKLQFQVGLDARVDYRVMAFTALVAVFAVLLFGLLPALRATPDVRSSLGGRWTVAGHRKARRGARRPHARDILVVTQLALSLVLLVCGTLFVRSLIEARTMDLGMNTRGRAVISVNVGLQGYDQARGRRFYDDVLARVRALPEVTGASFVFPAPFDTYGRGIGLYVEGLHGSRDGTIGVRVSFAADGFIPALGLRLQGGRDLALSDSAKAPLVMVVSRSLATRIWPGKNPIGQRARLGNASGREITVVGVVADAKFGIVAETNDARAYIPVRQVYRDWETLIVATRGGAAAALPRLRDVIASIDPALPTFGASTMEDAVASGFSSSRMAATLASLFAGLTLLIASVGLYAMVASGVSNRTREIGVRTALGATPLVLLRELMRGGARLGALGLGVGLLIAFPVAKTMASLLFGIQPTDPVTFVVVPLTLAAVVLIATYLPARRAVSRDPVAALRAE